jgi:hypothetical protein
VTVGRPPRSDELPARGRRSRRRVQCYHLVRTSRVAASGNHSAILDRRAAARAQIRGRPPGDQLDAAGLQLAGDQGQPQPPELGDVVASSTGRRAGGHADRRKVPGANPKSARNSTISSGSALRSSEVMSRAEAPSRGPANAARNSEADWPGRRTKNAGPDGTASVQRPASQRGHSRSSIGSEGSAAIARVALRSRAESSGCPRV